MAEIGCYRGVSTAVFATFAKTVHAVDPWAFYPELPYGMILAAEPLFDEVCGEHSNIIKHKGRSVDVAKEFNDETLDMIYIDGDHSPEAVRLDFDSWIPKVKRGGIIAGHDYCLVHAVIARPVKVYPDHSWIYEKSH